MHAAPASSPSTTFTAPSTSSVASSRPSKIDSFQGNYRFLSNFFPATIEYEGITYPSVENAYQASKSSSVEDHKRIAAISDPGDAKREGRLLTLRDDWDTLKFKVMEDCVRYKFTHHLELKEKLLATGDAILEEGNTWNDQIWGVSNGQGQNRLGKILMKVREELKAKPATTQAATPATQAGK
jgi:hypothetical protein